MNSCFAMLRGRAAGGSRRAPPAPKPRALWVSPHMHEPGHVKAALADAIRSLAPFEDLANGLPTGAMEKIEATAEPGSGQAVFRSIVICRRGGALQGGGTPAFVRRSPSGIRA